MVRRPGSTDRYLAILELASSRHVAVLIFFDLLGINQVGDINNHPAGIHPLATDLLGKRIEEAVNLDGKCLGLALAIAV